MVATIPQPVERHPDPALENASGPFLRWETGMKRRQGGEVRSGKSKNKTKTSVHVCKTQREAGQMREHISTNGTKTRFTNSLGLTKD